MEGKKAQSAVEVSVLIFLIAVAMVGYIILLPADDRAELLGEDVSNGSSGSGSESGSQTLLSESPGKVTSEKSRSQAHALEPIRLYSTTESNSKTLISSLTVSRNILQNNYKTITFDVDNMNDLADLKLLFLVGDSKGPLTITLNDQVVYEGVLSSNELPLSLPLDSLQESGNILKLSTGLGWNIFSPNYYLVQDMQLIESYTVADTTSTRTFSVDEPSEVRSAALNYFVTCNADEDGILTIALNNREVFSDKIFCSYLNVRELALDEDYLQSTNTLKFTIDKGDYNIEEAEVTVNSNTRDYPSFTFDVDSDLYQEIQSGDKDVYVKMTFSDDTSEKKGTILMQEYSFSFDTESDSYEKKISSYIDDGSNRITLEPSTDFEVDSLKVYVK